MIRLREATLADAPFVDERASDPTSMGEFNDFGRAHRTLAETLAERGRLVGFEKGQLLIERLSDGKLVGDVSWHAVSYGPGDRSKPLNFGLSLIPDARGHGYGTEAQRLLAALLFGIIVLAGGDWIPGMLIVAASLIGLGRQIPVINKLCRQVPPSPPHGKPTG